MPQLVHRRGVIAAGRRKPILRRQPNRIRRETIISSPALRVLDICPRGLQQFFSLLNRIPVIRALRFQCWNSIDLLSIEYRGRNHFRRVLTTSARNPPLKTDKFAALWRIAAPVHPIRRSNCAESGYCELIRPRKGLTSNNEVGKTAKAQSLPQNAPILKEFFGPMWLVRVKFQNNFRRCRCIELQILLYR